MNKIARFEKVSYKEFEKSIDSFVKELYNNDESIMISKWPEYTEAFNFAKEENAIETIKEAVADDRYDNMQVRMEAKEKISSYVAKCTGKRPMILPAIVEVNVENN